MYADAWPLEARRDTEARLIEKGRKVDKSAFLDSFSREFLLSGTFAASSAARGDPRTLLEGDDE